MSTLSLLRGAAPAKLVGAVRARGVAGAAQHAVRRVGALANHALVGPEVVQINPTTFVCNHTCPMCWLQHVEPSQLREMQRREKHERLDLADYVKLFDEMLPGLGEVRVIGGGEPLAHPDAVAIMGEVKRRGWRGSLVSNGSLLTERVAKALIDMRWDHTRISVHAGDAETYRRVQGVDRFDDVRRNLAFFDSYRRAVGARGACRLVVLHVVQPANVDTVDRLFAFAEEVGADEVVFDLVVTYSEGLRLSADEVRRCHQALAAGARATGLRCVLPRPAAFLRWSLDGGGVGSGGASEPEAPAGAAGAAAGAAVDPQASPAANGTGPDFVPGKRCSVGFDETFVTSFGDVRPCCFSTERMGNVRTQTFGEIWRSARYADFRSRLINARFASYCIENRCTLASVLPY